MTHVYNGYMVEHYKAPLKNTLMHTHMDIDSVRLISESRRHAQAFERDRARARTRARIAYAIRTFLHGWVVPFLIAAAILPFLYVLLVGFLLIGPAA